MRKISVLFCFAILSLISCGEDDACSNVFQAPQNIDLDVEAANINTIEKYLLDNNLTAQKTENDLYYIISEAGSALKPELCSAVLCSYTGYLPNGDVFDMSAEEGVPFSLFNVIKGWQEGIPLIGVGGKIQLFIPTKLAYGRFPPTTDIPENSSLIFEVELLAF